MNYVTKTIQFKNNDKINLKAKHILLCGDKNYIKYCGVTLTSILLSNKTNNFEFHIFCDEISDIDLDKLKNTSEKFNATINIYYLNIELINKFSKDMQGKSHLSIASYFRFIAFGELAKKINKVLYLDSDVLVKGDINIFWNIDIKNIVAIVIKDKFEGSHNKRLNVDKYFNAGVILVNLKEWNLNNYSQSCIKMATEKVYEFLDQDILNLVLNKKTIYIDKKYNYYYSLSRVLDESKKPSKELLNDNIVICHFCGASKPWHSWVQCLDAVKKYNLVKNNSAWSDNKIINPFEMKHNKYKYMHKFARLSKKEGNYKKMLYWYFEYAVNKIMNK